MAYPDPTEDPRVGPYCRWVEPGMKVWAFFAQNYYLSVVEIAAGDTARVVCENHQLAGWREVRELYAYKEP